MLSQMKWLRTGMAALMVGALLAGLAFAAKPPKDPPPEPDPPTALYYLTLLDELPSASVNGMNESGVVVGEARLEDGDWAAWIESPTLGMIYLNTLLPEGSGWHLESASDVNDWGQIVGSGRFNGEPREFRFTPAVVIEDLGQLYPDAQSQRARSINNAGEVCGYGRDVNGVGFAWYFNDIDGIQPLLDGLDDAKAYVINNEGQILGLVQADPNVAFRVVPGGIPEFFYGDSALTTHDMNDGGVFVGGGYFNVQVKKRVLLKYMAYRHDGTSFFDLGTGVDAVARGINNANDVVGTLPRDGYHLPGFVYLESEQEAISLDNVVAGEVADLALWVNEYTSVIPERINDAGQICGRISNSAVGYVASFVLTPISP